MANTRESVTKHLELDEHTLVKTQEEQRNIERKPGHAGFKDASSRNRDVEDCDALDDSIHKDKERISDRILLP